ncbi:PKD-like family lipoprotein [Pedobacter nyackensis]|uniref:PKD-like family protein n=1 Tax=Pedobacter nyackensis TaxID=475255 RepID=A0A1W2CQB2_9SPHI|nr:PKD-like family lipoprotein [Pedobacter nyackensis]SMC87447.1 PKD-like family protein [Pedobacter nyackensis]
MKKTKITLLSAIVVSVLFIGCYKDKGNYDYQDPEAVNIATDMDKVDRTVFITADSIDLNQNDSLKVRLKINSSIGVADDYNYQWLVTQYSSTNQNPKTNVIGSGVHLDAKIVLPPDLYRLVVKLTSKKSGIEFYKHFALNVSAAAWGREGWLVLQDQSIGGGADLSVITTRDGSVKGQVYNNVYSLFNKHKLPAGTYKVNVTNYATNLRAQRVTFFYPNGGVEVRSTDFADSTKSEGWFVVPPGNTNFQLNGSAGGSGAGWEYIINNNQISYRQVSALSIKNPPIFFSPPYLGSFTLSPFVISSANSDSYMTLYDKANRCFLLLRVETGTFVPANPDVPNKHFVNYAGTASDLNPVTGSGFDLNNMQHNLVHAENAQPMTTNNGYWNCIFRNEGGDATYLIQFQRAITYANNFKTGRYLLTEANCPGINSATMFACPTYLSLPEGAFYYVNGNNIYKCEVNPLATSIAKVGLTFPAGTVIKVMKTLNSGYTAANLPATEGRVLVVATDESASGGGHKVYFFNLNATGDITGSPENPADVYTGFDKITDITFKKALGR